MRPRLVAAAVAVALVAGAYVVRRNVIDADDGGGTASSSEQLICIAELAEVCGSVAAGTDLDVVVEDAGRTLDRLAALDPDADAPLWVTVEPYPAMADALRESTRADSLAFTATPLAASELAVALPADGRLDVLLAECAEQPIWRCVGDHAGARWSDLGGESRWGTVRPAFGDVTDSVLGLGSFAAAVAGYFDDAGVSRSRWESDTSFIPWLRRLASSASGAALSGGTALGTMATRPSALDIAATASFELAERDAGSQRFALNYPRPEMWLQAVLAVPAGVAAPDGFIADLAGALQQAGWDAPGAAAAPLPGAATMLALRALWEDAT